MNTEGSNHDLTSGTQGTDERHEIFIYLFICDLLHEVVSSLKHIVSDNMMINEQATGKDMEGNDWELS
jgi:hypothetical protein